MSNPRKWPTDLDACHRLLAEQAALAEDLRNALEQADEVSRDKDQLIQDQRLEIQLYRRFIFGPRRERIVDGQGQQFLFEIDTSEPEPEVEVEPKPEAPARPRPKRVSRQLELDKLPRFASSTTSPRPRKPAIVAASPRPKSARTNRESSNSSPPGSNFKSMSCPSTPARGAKLASPRRNRQPGRSPRPWPAPACSPS